MLYTSDLYTYAYAYAYAFSNWKNIGIQFFPYIRSV